MNTQHSDTSRKTACFQTYALEMKELVWLLR
jgi:hypothetical protein